MEVDPIYGSSEIRLFDLREHVLRRPAMYVGSTDSKGVRNLLLEAVAPSARAALRGQCTWIEVEVQRGTIEVHSNAPIQHRTAKVSSEELVQIVTGHPEMEEDSCWIPMQSLGLFVVNFLSRRFEICVRSGRSGQKVICENGAPIEASSAPAAPNRATLSIRFSPLAKVFGKAGLVNLHEVSALLQDFATCLPKTRFCLYDHHSGVRQEYYYAAGVEDRLRAESSLHAGADIIGAHVLHGTDRMDIAICESQWKVCRSFINLMPAAGGSHVHALQAALVDMWQHTILRRELALCGVSMIHPEQWSGCVTALMPEPRSEHATAWILDASNLEGPIREAITRAIVLRRLLITRHYLLYGLVVSFDVDSDSDSAAIEQRWLIGKLHELIDEPSKKSMLSLPDATWPTSLLRFQVTIGTTAAAARKAPLRIAKVMLGPYECSYVAVPFPLLAIKKAASLAYMRDRMADSAEEAIRKALQLLSTTEHSGHVPKLSKSLATGLRQFRALRPRLPAALEPYCTN